jgi:deazaflavin-dependent oxidoreductase (nitroreductase family)
MPSDLMLKSMNTIHRTLMKVSFGKIGWTAGGMTVLDLTTIGRKSGQARSVMLTSPTKVGDSYVIVASRGGDDTHPAWFLNLRDNPKVQVALQGKPKQSMMARIASAEERAELWPTVTKKYKGYANYQTKTDREIPLIFLDPAPSNSGSSSSASAD